MNLWWIALLFFLPYTTTGYFMRKYLSGPSKCKPDEEEPWSYREKNGPKKWGRRYPTCNGQQQSPIDIKSYNAVYDQTLPKLTMKNYDVPVTRATVENNGHSIQVTPSDGVERSILVNGEVYNLAQFHFHWGDAPDRGAEHTVNGVQYSMELHFVHMNAKREIAVVGVFFQEQEASKNGELQNIVSLFPKVMYRSSRSEIKSPLNLNNFLPANPSSYFRLEMKEFRKLYSVKKPDASKHCRLTDNYRPIQPINKRTVYLSQ